MKSTMQDVPLSVGRLLRHAVTTHPTAEVVTATAEGSRTASFAEIGQRVGRLANALRHLGVHGDDRVGTLLWNTQEHVEAYLAVPSMGAVLHTVNIRLSEEQLVFVVNHAEDKVLLIDDSLVKSIAPAIGRMKTLEHVIVVGADGPSVTDQLQGHRFEVHLYLELLQAASSSFEWPEVDERDAAAICYTSGTTGDPKGVAYSHRSIYLHSMACAMGDGMSIGTYDRVLPVVPMFHANAWGMPYTAMLVGATLVLPNRFMTAAALIRLIEQTRPTIAAGVPTIWNDVLGTIKKSGGDLSSLRLIIGGGSLVTVSLQREMKEVCGVLMLQAWGMTETSPTALVGWPPVEEHDPGYWVFRAKQGRLMSSVEARVVAEDGSVLPRDGQSVGELEVRGPYVTSSYYRLDSEEPFHDGWLRTGDLGTIDGLGFVGISDRAKDMIKSGGEWISSVDLEAAIVGHPAVREAAVIGIPDERWEERPMAIVALIDGAEVTTVELREYLADGFAKWQIPETWAFVEEVSRTSVGKYDKKTMRLMYAEHRFDIS